MKRRYYIGSIGSLGVSLSTLKYIGSDNSSAISFQSVESDSIESKNVDSDNIIITLSDITIKLDKINKSEPISVEILINVDSDSKEFTKVRDHKITPRSRSEVIKLDSLSVNLSNTQRDVSNATRGEIKLRLQHPSVQTDSRVVQIINPSDLPSNGIYLDDWADNKLTNRKNYADLSLSEYVQESSSSSYSNPKRADWTIESGSPTVSSNEVIFDATSNDAITAPLTENAATWEFEFQYQSDPSDAQNLTCMVFGTSTGSWDTGTIMQTEGKGYQVIVGGGSNFLNVQRVSNGANETAILGSSGWDFDTKPHTLKVKRDNVGNWEFYYDGNLEDTTTESKYTTAEKTAFGLTSRGSVQCNINWFRVF